MVDLYMCVYVVKMISIYLFMPFVIYSYVCIFFVIHILKSKANVSEYQIPNATKPKLLYCICVGSLSYHSKTRFDGNQKQIELLSSEPRRL